MPRPLLLATLLLAVPTPALAQNAPVTFLLTNTVQPPSLGGGPLALSPDGRTLAVNNGVGWALLDTGTLEQKALVAMDTRRFPSPGVQFSPDGKLLLSDVGGVAVFGARTGRALWQASQGRAAFSSAGQRVYLVSPSGKLSVLAARTGEVLRGEKNGTDTGSAASFYNRPLSLAVHPAGKLLASGSFGGGIVLWNAETGERKGTLTDKPSSSRPAQAALAGKTAHGGRVVALTFAPDGTLVSGGNDGTLKLWNPETGQKLAEAPLPGGVQAMTLLAGGKGVLVASGKDVVQLSLPDLQQERVLVGHADKVGSLALAGDTLWTSSADGTVKRWNLKSGLDEATYGQVKVAAVSPDGQTFALNLGDTTVRLTDTTGKTLKTLRGFLPPASPRYEFIGGRSLAFSPNGKGLASGLFTLRRGAPGEQYAVGSAAYVWDTESGRQERVLRNFPSQDLAWSLDGGFLAGVSRVQGELDAFEIRDVATGASVGQGVPSRSGAEQEQNGVLAIAVPTVQWVKGQAWVLGAQYPLLVPGKPLPSQWPSAIWQARTGQKVQSLGNLGISTPRFAVNPAGTRAAVSGGNGLWMLDARTGKALRSYPQAKWQDQFWSCQEERRLLWSPDGRLLALNGGEQGFSLHDGSSGQPLGRLPVRAEPLGFSKDGRTLVTLNEQGVQVWQIRGK